jgi:hypothetical protein
MHRDATKLLCKGFGKRLIAVHPASGMPFSALWIVLKNTI